MLGNCFLDSGQLVRLRRLENKPELFTFTWIYMHPISSDFPVLYPMGDLQIKLNGKSYNQNVKPKASRRGL